MEMASAMIGTMSTTHVGLTEIGEMFTVSRQRAYALTKKKGFPAPAGQTKAGRFWNRAEVAAWGETWDRTNPGGRPKQQPDAAE
jgi:predicted DNA-binding transcriptional regulator AlpA